MDRKGPLAQAFVAVLLEHRELDRPVGGSRHHERRSHQRDEDRFQPDGATSQQRDMAAAQQRQPQQFSEGGDRKAIVGAAGPGRPRRIGRRRQHDMPERVQCRAEGQGEDQRGNDRRHRADTRYESDVGDRHCPLQGIVPQPPQGRCANHGGCHQGKRRIQSQGSDQEDVARQQYHAAASGDGDGINGKCCQRRYDEDGSRGSQPGLPGRIAARGQSIPHWRRASSTSAKGSIGLWSTGIPSFRASAQPASSPVTMMKRS